MTNYDPNTDKTGGYSLKPATVTVEQDDEQITIDAAHHYRNDRDTLLFLCVEEREGGADVVVPLCSDKHAYATSDTGREALNMTDETEKRLVADGGRDEAVNGGDA